MIEANCFCERNSIEDLYVLPSTPLNSTDKIQTGKVENTN